MAPPNPKRPEMVAETRLKHLLDKAGFSTRGRLEQIARETGLARHTVRKFYYNEALVFSLETVGRICAWLARNGLGDGLPGTLFAIRPPAMMTALMEPGHVTMYVGVYQGRGRPGFARSSIARDDFAVAARLVERLSRSSQRTVRISYIHVPSHVALDGHTLDRSVLERDQAEARRIFEKARRNTTSGTSVMIGSQRANYVVECFVAELWNAEAFSSENSPVPFYLKYPEPTRSSSCFGGDTAPVTNGTTAPDGIYFRHRGKKDWEFFPSEPRQSATGMVIVRRDPGLGRVELAVFGLSGIATSAMGTLLCRMPDRFLPTGPVRAGIQVGVYVCGFDISAMTSDEQDIDTITIGTPRIVELDVDVRGRRRPAA